MTGYDERERIGRPTQPQRHPRRRAGGGRTRQKTSRRKAKFASVSKADSSVRPSGEKFLFRFFVNCDLVVPTRLMQRGVRVVTTRGAGCGGRDDVVTTSDVDRPCAGAAVVRRRGAGARSSRTAKSCGPDTPTLVSSATRLRVVADATKLCFARIWWPKSPAHQGDHV